MKQFKFLSIATAALMMLGACSDKDFDLDGENPLYPTETQEGVYVAVNIDLPSAGGYTRSQTITPGPDGSQSNSGVEIGQDYENYVGEVLIVLARNPITTGETNAKNAFIAAATVPTNNITSVAVDKSSYQLLSSLSLTQLQAFYDRMAALNQTDFACNVYVFANPGQTIKNIIFGNEQITAPALLSTGWVNSIIELQDVPENNIANKLGNGGKGAFLMANAVEAPRQLPGTINDWRYYTTDANPFDLSGDNNEIAIDNSTNGGAVKLERAAARFDFRDGSPLGNFSYHVVREGDASLPEAQRTPLIDVQLVNMSLVNVNKNFYAIRRVSDDGLPANATICGPERPWRANTNGTFTGGNYVVDADQLWKTTTAESYDDETGEAPGNITYGQHFFWPLFTENGKINNVDGFENWYTSNCADVVKGQADNPESWNPADTDGTRPYGQYHIWTYATENTIAGIENQKNGISTGIIFKGKMIATADALNSPYPETKELAQAINNTTSTSPFLFMFGGNLYVKWEGIRNAALNAAVSGIEWVPDSEEDPTKGKFEFTSIDRSNSLYVAVFGNGGFGTVEFTYTEYDKDTGKPITDEAGNVIQHKGALTDTEALDPNCADAKWNAYAANNSTSNLATAKKATTDAKITIYQPGNDGGAGWGYYCYYYYWNRHNNLGTNVDNNGTMNPMEFAVVRNNVYKLAVTNIKQLGHPRLSDNDPNRPTGGTDDETQNVYLTVTAEVLPWVVRLNNIEF